MKIIVSHEINVFDDDQYCNNHAYRMCDNIHYKSGFCEVFRVGLEHKDNFLKTNQCKEYYKKVKSQIVSCHICGKEGNKADYNIFLCRKKLGSHKSINMINK